MPRTAIAPRPEPSSDGRPGWAALFGALPMAVLLVDPGDRIAHTNALAERLLNLSERMMLGRPVSDLIRLPREHVAQRGQDLSIYDTDLVTHGGAHRVDYAVAHVPGHDGWRAITLHPAAPGHVPGRGEGGRAAIGAAAMLAHEIRNPLSGIRGAAQLLGPGELTALIVTEVDRVAALIDRMQDFTDTRPLPLSAENIYPILAHARDVARAGFAAGLPIEERYDPSLPHARVNRDALTQILLNLIRNAVQAVEGAGRPHIAITTAYRHGVIARIGRDRQRMPLPIEICVVDDGPGAPPDIADRLFDPFVSGRPEGTGLGLALVDKLVRDMGGLVQYAREQDRTVLRLLLPKATA